MDFLKNGALLYVVLGFLIFGLVGWILFTYIRDKINKKKIHLAGVELDKLTKKYLAKFDVEINEVIAQNKRYLEKFVVSVGEYKMGELTNFSRKKVIEILEDSDFKNYVLKNPKYAELVKNLSELKDVKSNMWESKALPNLTYFSNELKKLTSVTLTEEEEREIKERVALSYGDNLRKKKKTS